MVVTGYAKCAETVSTYNQNDERSIPVAWTPHVSSSSLIVLVDNQAKLFCLSPHFLDRASSAKKICGTFNRAAVLQRQRKGLRCQPPTIPCRRFDQALDWAPMWDDLS